MTYLDGYDPTVRLICVLVFVIVILAAVLLVYIYKDRQNRREVERLKKALGDFGLENAYLRGKGCPYCDYRGVIGRTVVGEFVIPDSTFLELMLKGETKKAIDYWTSELNGRTLKDNAISRMLKGTVDIEEVERWTGLLDERPTY